MPSEQLRQQLLSWLDSRSARPGETALVFVVCASRHTKSSRGIRHRRACPAGALFANQKSGANVPFLATARLVRAERCF